MKSYSYLLLVPILLFLTSCTFMYVPFIPDNPQMREARFLMSESEGLSVEAEQLRLDINVKEIPESDWLAVQWFSPLSKEVASESKWLEVSEENDTSGQSLSFNLSTDVTLTPGYWRAVVSYQGRLIRQFGFDYSLVVDEGEESSNLNEDNASETSSEEISNEPTETEGN